MRPRFWYAVNIVSFVALLGSGSALMACIGGVIDASWQMPSAAFVAASVVLQIVSDPRRPWVPRARPRN